MELVPLSDAELAQAVAWHRQVAAMVEAADRAGAAAEELPGLRASLAAQAGQLGQAASRIGAPLPALMPTPAEVASAGANLGDLSAEAVTSAVRTMWTTLTAVDASLAGKAGRAADRMPPTPSALPATPAQRGVLTGNVMTPNVTTSNVTLADLPTRGVLTRNVAVYGAYAAVVLVVQAFLFVLLDESSLPTAAPLCLLILPAFAWAAGWLTIGVLHTPGPDGTLDRSPRAGVGVCMIPNALLCAGVIVLFVANKFH